MTPERWQRIKGVLCEVMELPPERRSQFLDRACSGEESLRKEVDSLLSSGDQICSDFLQSAVESCPLLMPRSKLAHYEVLSLLGAGGMGEVYRGHDPRLGRDVAIKILPQLFSKDPERLRRFEQEARATAAINHPNIVAVYDVGTTNDATPYVVSELLEGETLRQCLNRGPLAVRKAVDLAFQMASGLAAAHHKGIIHRDLKPENLFLTNEGHLKILDFGLAKLVRSPVSTEAPTLTGKTDAGAVMGTLGYMPPEQLRGLAVDQRSDIFATGAILYEMLSGRRAFRGETNADTIEAILSRDPPALSETNSAIPPAFERLVRRCLEKNPNERFHSIRDVAYALEAISDAPTSSTGTQSQPAQTRLASKGRYAFVGVTALIALVLAGTYLFRRMNPAMPPPQDWEQLTNFPDSAVYPVLSPDGRMLAFLRGPQTFATAGDLYLKLLPQGEPVQLTHDGNLKATPVFSPDGSRIAYTVAPPWDTWVVPVLGGKAAPMLPNASGLTWVDDRHILFSEIKTGIHMAVVTATEGRADERDIYVPAQDAGMAHHSYLSPDHKWVLIASEMDSQDNLPCRLVPFDGSSSGRIVGPPRFTCSYAGWSPDGKWMFFSASNRVSGFHLWRQRFPDGEPQQLTVGPTEQEGVAVSPDGRSLLTSVGLTNGTVWVHDKTGERQVPFAGSARLTMGEENSRAIFSPDGTKLYFLGTQNPKNPEELWTADITSEVIDCPLPGISIGSFDVSSDGRKIVFDSRDAQGESHLWIAGLDRRSAPRRLESDSPEDHPLFGPNDDVFFQGEENGHSYVYRRPAEGGQRTKVMPSPVTFLQTISADGKWMVADMPVSDEELTRAVVAYNLADGTRKRVCGGLCIVRWSLDGKSLYLGLPGGSGHSGNFKTVVVPLRHGDSFPPLPTAGVKTDKDLTGLGGVKVIDELARPGPEASLYASDRQVPHRNIYRIPIQ